MLCILYSQFHDFLSGNFTHREGRFEQVAKKLMKSSTATILEKLKVFYEIIVKLIHV